MQSLTSPGRRAPNYLLAASVAVLVAMPSMVQASPPVTMEELDVLALQENQNLQAFDARALELRQQAQFEAQRRPEPMLEVMLDVSAPWTPHFTTGQMIRLMQPIPRGGARQAQAAPTRAAVGVVTSRKRDQSLSILRDTRLDIIELARIDARIGLLQEERELIEDALGIADARTPLGGGEYDDFFQLELARETVLDRVAELKSVRASRQARLSARLGGDSPVSSADTIAAEVLTSWSVELPDREELVDLVRESAPGLATLSAQQRELGQRIELVDQRQRPWPTLIVGYTNRPAMWEMDGPRDQMIQVGVSMALPIFGGQYDAEASRWQAAAQAVEAELVQESRDAVGELLGLIAQWDSDRRRLKRHHQELVPLADDLAGRVLIGMELGERSAAEYLLAVRQEIELQGRIIELQAAQLRRLMEIQHLTGGAVGQGEPWAYPEIEGERR